MVDILNLALPYFGLTPFDRKRTSKLLRYFRFVAETVTGAKSKRRKAVLIGSISPSQSCAGDVTNRLPWSQLPDAVGDRSSDCRGLTFEL
jgi:hypothetical protein